MYFISSLSGRRCLFTPKTILWITCDCLDRIEMFLQVLNCGNVADFFREWWAAHYVFYCVCLILLLREEILDILLRLLIIFQQADNLLHVLGNILINLQQQVSLIDNYESRVDKILIVMNHLSHDIIEHLWCGNQYISFAPIYTFN